MGDTRSAQWVGISMGAVLFIVLMLNAYAYQ